jgi:hypothetical protein
MNAIEFHAWLTDTQSDLKVAGEAPVALCAAVLARLAQGLTTLDSAVLLAFGAMATWEGQQAGGYRQTLAYGEACIARSPGQAPRWALLRMRMADLLAVEGALTEAHALRELAHQGLYAQEIAALQLRVENQVEAGMEALRRNDKADAERHFLDVMSVNWTNVDDAAALQRLRAFYVRAAQGLIACRAGDAAALRDIFFIPAALAELAPERDRAIAAAMR